MDIIVIRGQSSGKSVSFTGIEWNRFVNGFIQEHRAEFDAAGLLAQIGALSTV